MSLLDTKTCDGPGETIEPASPPPCALKPNVSAPPATGVAARQAGIGNSMLAAAAIGGSPPNSDNFSELQASYGNSALARAFIQRKPDGEEGSGVEATTAAAAAAGQATDGGAD